MARQAVRRMFLTVLAVGWLILSPESHAAVVSHPTVQEILAAFGRAEAAVQKQDLDPLLQFYAKDYNYHGLKPADVRRIWGEVFTHYRNLSSTHLFSEVKVFRSGSQLHAEITCTGGLYGTEAQGGTRITLDSWFHEVHYLVHEDGAWRFLGNAGAAPSSAPFTSQSPSSALLTASPKIARRERLNVKRCSFPDSDVSRLTFYVSPFTKDEDGLFGHPASPSTDALTGC